MFCGKCGKNIGDSKVCPYCNPQNPANEVFGQPKDEVDSPTVLLSGMDPTNPYPSDDDDVRTTLFTDTAASAPEASLGGNPDDADNPTVLLSGINPANPYQSSEEDVKTTLFNDTAATNPEASLSGNQGDDVDSPTVLLSGLRQEQAPAAPARNDYASASQQNPYGYNSPVGQPIENQAPQNNSYSYSSPAMQTPVSTPSYNSAPVTEEPKKKKSKKGLVIGIVTSILVVLIGAGVILYFTVLKDLFAYNSAIDHKDKAEYSDAIDIFEDLGDYKDSQAQITECKYLLAKQQIDDGEYEEARSTLTELGDYKDSKDQLDKCNYLDAKQMLADGKYDEAKTAFKALGDYEDSKELIKECDYGRATKLLNDKKYTEAKKIFESLNGYSDSKTKIKECDYNIAKSKISSNPSDAIDILEDLGSYEDSEKLLKQAKMNYCKKNKDSSNATTYKYLKELKEANYSGAAALYKELYTIKIINVYWNTDTSDHSTKMTKIKEGEKAVLHFEMTGYTPDTYYFKVQLKAYDASGASDEDEMGGIYTRFAYGLLGASKGTLTVEIYSADGSEKLYTATVQIV